LVAGRTACAARLALCVLLALCFYHGAPRKSAFLFATTHEQKRAFSFLLHRAARSKKNKYLATQARAPGKNSGAELKEK
jgi:hypothetical protein